MRRPLGHLRWLESSRFDVLRRQNLRVWGYTASDNLRTPNRYRYYELTGAPVAFVVSEDRMASCENAALALTPPDAW
jgi:hypothetical protein